MLVLLPTCIVRSEATFLGFIIEDRRPAPEAFERFVVSVFFDSNEALRLAMRE